MTRQLIPLLPTLDLRALTDAQLATAATVFNEFRDLELQPAHLADADPNRALLDRRVVCDLLGLDDEIYQAVRSSPNAGASNPPSTAASPAPAPPR